MAPRIDYNHSHDLSVAKAPCPHEDAAGAHLRSFRFPIRPIPDSVFVCPAESPGRHSAESQISPGYESDAESIAMPSPIPSRRKILTRSLSSTGASRPGGQFDDTTWRGREQPDARHPRKAEVIILGGISASEEGTGSRSINLEREPATSSQLHPYVRNFI